MNVARAFGEYLQNSGVATFGQDLFISRAPTDDDETPNRIFWLKASGGSVVGRSVNGGERKQYVIEIYHRDVTAESVYETMQELGDDLSCAGCLTLTGYTVVEVNTDGPWTDQDLDSEEREVGLLRINIVIAKEC